MIKILRDGEFFAHGLSLESAAESVGEDVSRYSFDAQEHVEYEYRQALSRLFHAHSAALADVQTRFPQTEREGWGELVKDAELGAGECLGQYAGEMGLSLSDAADRILAARAAYRTAYGAATGRLTKLRDHADGLYQAGDVDGLKALGWESVL